MSWVWSLLCWITWNTTSGDKIYELSLNEGHFDVLLSTIDEQINEHKRRIQKSASIQDDELYAKNCTLSFSRCYVAWPRHAAIMKNLWPAGIFIDKFR